MELIVIKEQHLDTAIYIILIFDKVKIPLINVSGQSPDTIDYGR